jgi:LPXTG-motif cell wall-anchored protein
MRFARVTFSRLLAGAAICVAAGNILVGQARTTTSEVRGQTSVTTQVERAEVVYVSGNELVVKMESGEVRHLTVPDGVTATVDGRQLTVRDLKPGMKLQRTVTTTTTPKTVTTVRTVSGRVVSVIPPLSLILSFPDGSPNKQYQIPKDQVFVVDGERKTAFDLRPGMPVSATVVTSGPVAETNVTRTVTGTAPAPPPPARPATPPPQPVLLIEVTVTAPPTVAAAPPPAPAPARAPEPAPTQLPKTGSPVPLIGLLGVLMVGASFGLRVLRR